MFKRSIFTAATLALIATTAGVGSAIATAGNTVDPNVLERQMTVIATSTTPIGDQTPVASVEPAASKAFEAFKELPASPVPADLAKGIASSKKFGRNASLARSFDTPTGTGYLVPGRGYVCLAVPAGEDGYATTCQPTPVAADDGLQVSIGLDGKDPDTDVAVTTVAPTGSDVVQTAPDGSTSPAPTSDGVSSTVVPSDTAVTVVN